MRRYILQRLQSSGRLLSSMSSPSQPTPSVPLQQGFITGYFCNKPASGSSAGTPEISISSTTLSTETKDAIKQLLERTNAEGKKGERRVFYNVDTSLPFQLAATALGSSPNTGSTYEKRESVRRAVANGIRSLSSQGVKEYILDTFCDAQAAAEGAILSSYSYMKFAENCKSLSFKMVPGCTTDDIQSFKRGLIMASAQNIARYLADTPANLCTPTKFVEAVEKIAKEHLTHVSSHLKIEAKDAAWAKGQGMNLFLSVAQGSAEPCKFLIMEYQGRRANNLSPENEQPIGLVGKGITFDAGGISLKPATNMANMRADMQGAAIMAVSLLTVAFCKLPIDLVAAIPLTENLPSGTATKPGDVFTASNGKTVEVNNTDAEGRLILADALVYMKKHSPSVIIDAATLTGSAGIALGSAASAIFSTCDVLFNEMEEAGCSSGDRIWRLPLWNDYFAAMESTVADMKNSGGSAGGVCSAAAFLKEFVDDGQTWAHLDIAGTMESCSEDGALSKGMSGRPLRMLLYWLFERSNTALGSSGSSLNTILHSLPEEKISAFCKCIPQ